MYKENIFSFIKKAAIPVGIAAFS
jgi:hypothetical protein